LGAFNDAFITYPVSRYDLKGKRLLKSQQKIYLADPGMRTAIAGRQPGPEFGHILENIVYLELRRRYTNVWVGKANAYEVDFVAQDKNGYIEYFQVALTLRDSEVLQRELRALRGIPDVNPRYLLCFDPEEAVYDGIKQLNLLNWLLAD
ncbi:MAG: DUF4143 domain-containing protein, partial [Coriobacteriales bacterium]|nr:DUF4143 domain-containing protein [Coriobacteriales bacterium]